jgi:NAD(P)-dependent dehydrogenase (short-subunit alcohol dehydrogenase family)
MEMSDETSEARERRTAVITGAGSGVGRAIAVRLSGDGWDLALIGRTRSRIEETVTSCRQNIGQFGSYDCDVGNATEVATAATAILSDFPRVDAVINAAGENISQRSLDVLMVDDFERVIRTNLNGSFFVLREFLPRMRSQKSGTIINIVSDVGLLANPKAGTAYVASKFGQGAMIQSINHEEQAHGIRACALFPGDINTPLLDKRAHPPSEEARLKMLQTEDLSECVSLVLNLPARAVVEQIVIRPRFPSST